jgi:hypothetical protein
VVTDPASNVPAGSVSIGTVVIQRKFEEGYNYHFARGYLGNENFNVSSFAFVVIEIPN